MTIGARGQNLIFLVSQPRTGSTLLQRILGGHAEIETRSEPWLMLPPLYALRRQKPPPEGELATVPGALREFLQSLPGGEDDYFEGVRRMYVYLYNQALAATGKRLYLDKTPRYYLILPELYSAFPEARFVILLRNPLAVLVSVVQTWHSDSRLSLLALYRFRGDLLEAPCLIVDGLAQLGEQAAVVRYEDLVADPEREVQRLCEWLGVSFSPDLIEYGRQEMPAWRLGDLDKVFQHRRPVAGHADEWQRALRAPQVWRLARDYAQALGDGTLERLGYPPAQMREILAASRPHPARLWFTVSLDWLMSRPRDPGRKWEKRLTRWSNRFGRRSPARQGQGS